MSDRAPDVGRVFSPLRRAAALVSITVAVAATMADTPPSTSVYISLPASTIGVDADRTVAVRRFVVTANAAAIESGASINVTVSISGVTPVGQASSGAATLAPRTGSLPAYAGMYMFLATRSPFANESVTGEVASPSSGSDDPNGRTELEVPLTGSPSFPFLFRCDSAGPCSHEFWLVAEAADPRAPVQATWSASAIVTRTTPPPSGATGTIVVDPATYLEGNDLVITTATPSETVALGPIRPTVARLVELRLGGAAFAGGDHEPFASIELQLNGLPISGGYYPRIIGLMRPVPTTSTSPSAPPVAALRSGDDPFSGCTRGVECVRNVLVSLAWTSGDATTMDWRLVVRRVGRGRMTDGARLSARVTRSFDVSSAPPTTVKVDGDVTARGSSRRPGALVFAPALSSTSTEPLVRYLPVPATATFTVNRRDTDPGSSSSPPYVQVTMTASVNGGWSPMTGEFDARLVNGVARIDANPFSACTLETTCPSLAVAFDATGGPGLPTPSVDLHWTLELQAYSFVDIPVAVSLGR